MTSSSYGGLVGEDQLLGHDLKVVQLESIYGRAESFLDLFDLPLTFALMKFLSSRFFSKVLRRLRWSIFFLRQSSVQSHSEDSNLEPWMNDLMLADLRTVTASKKILEVVEKYHLRLNLRPSRRFFLKYRDLAASYD